jgi:hypothetical protein
MTWMLPVAEAQRLRLGFSYQDSELLMSQYSSRQAIEWVLNNGENFEVFPGSATFGTRIKTLDLIAGWELEQRNRTLFPDQGMRLNFTIQASVPGSDIEYYVASFNVEKYFAVLGPWRFRINSEINFGDQYGEDTTALPPYKNFFGGGPRTVRGFKENYLGPRDSYGNPNGGNLMLVNQFELILPTPEKLPRGREIVSLNAHGRIMRRRVSPDLGITFRMPTLIPAPTVVAAAGNKPKKIEEYAGRVNSGHSSVSVAKMVSPQGWLEPGQRPEFEEITVVLRGMLRVEHERGTMDVRAGPAVVTRPGEWVR